MDVEANHRWGTVPAIDASTARQTFRDVVDGAAGRGQRLIITRNGRPVAAMVSLYDLDLLMRRESSLDERLQASAPLAVADVGSAVDFDDFVAESRERRKAKQASNRKVRAPALELAPPSTIGSGRLLRDAAVNVSLQAMADFLTERVAEIASEALITEVKERIERPKPIEEGDEVRIKEDFIETVRTSAMLDCEQSEDVLAPGGGVSDKAAYVLRRNSAAG